MGSAPSLYSKIFHSLTLKALSLGIFPYVLKLLTSQVQELREVLVFIWAKIFALERVTTKLFFSDSISHAKLML